MNKKMPRNLWASFCSFCFSLLVFWEDKLHRCTHLFFFFFFFFFFFLVVVFELRKQFPSSVLSLPVSSPLSFSLLFLRFISFLHFYRLLPWLAYELTENYNVSPSPPDSLLLLTIFIFLNICFLISTDSSFVIWINSK